MIRFYRLFWVLLFLVGAAVPLIHMDTAEITEQENRTLAKFPELRKKDKLNMNYGKEFESWLGDRFWGRDWLINTRFQALYKINGRIENDKAFIGDDGWMFEKKNTVNRSSIEKQRKRIEKDAKTLKKFADKFKGKNIPIYLVLIPEREVLYQKYWEKYYKPTPYLNYADEIEKLLKDYPNIKILPIQNKLKRMVNTELIFYKDDVHLTDIPRKLIIEEVFFRLKNDYLVGKNDVVFKKTRKVENVEHVASISAALGMAGKIRANLPTVTLSIPGLKSEKDIEQKYTVLINNGYKGETVIPYIKSHNDTAPISKVGIFLGPCYTESAYKVLSPLFQKSVKIRPSVWSVGKNAVSFIKEKLKELDKVKENSAAIIMIWDRDTFNAIEKVLK